MEKKQNKRNCLPKLTCLRKCAKHTSNQWNSFMSRFLILIYVVTQIYLITSMVLYIDGYAKLVDFNQELCEHTVFSITNCDYYSDDPTKNTTVEAKHNWVKQFFSGSKLQP